MRSATTASRNDKKRIELRTQEQPLVAKHIGGTIRDRNERSRNRRTDEVPFIAGCSHFTRKNTRFRAPASSPKQSPCNIHAAHSATTSLPHHFLSPPLHCQSFCDVLLCNVKSHTTLHQGQFFCDVLLCDVLLCNVKSHTTLHQGQSFCDALICSVKSHTTLHQGQSFCDALICSVKSHTTLHQGQFFRDVLLCNVKSHTTLHQGQSFCDVLLCNVKSHTTFHQGQSFCIPLWIKWEIECWCWQFYSDNSGDADPLSENASIESETPRYFQVDNLYRIDVAEVVYEHHSL